MERTCKEFYHLHHQSFRCRRSVHWPQQPQNCKPLYIYCSQQVPWNSRTNHCQSYFVQLDSQAIGLEHSVANLFIMPAVLLLKVPLTISDVLLSNVIPVLIGNAIAAPSSLQAATHISLANSAENAWRHSTSSKQHKRNELPCIKSRLLMVTKRQ